MSKIARIQIGHYPRKTGATGAYNSSLKISEQYMNKLLADAIQGILARLPQGDDVVWQFIEADERLYSRCDLFISLHMDGNNNPAVKRSSVGYPPSSKTSKAFADLLKKNYMALGIPNVPMRSDNYTRGLQYFYGYKASFSHYAPVKLVFENGFVTNNAELIWARDHVDRVAKMLVETVYEHFGVNPGILNEEDRLGAYKEIKTATGDQVNWAVRLWQQRLNAWRVAGDALVEDGLVGPKTEAAHQAWSKVNALTSTKRPGRFQWKRLLKDPQDPSAKYVPRTVIEQPEEPKQPAPVPERTYTEADLVLEVNKVREQTKEQLDDLAAELTEVKLKVALQGRQLEERQGVIRELEILVRTHERTMAEQAATIKDMTDRATRAKRVLNGKD